MPTTNGTTSDLVWTTWNQSYTTTTTYTVTSASTGNQIWNNSQVWEYWAGAATTLPPELRHDQIERTRRSFEEQRRKEREREAAFKLEREIARAAARDLLLSFLSPAQERSYKRDRRFEVVSNLDRLFRIDTVNDIIANNVALLREDKSVLATLCCHPPSSLPPEDVWLAQKLAIETDDKGFCTRANIVSHQSDGIRLARPWDVPRDRSAQVIQAVQVA